MENRSIDMKEEWIKIGQDKIPKGQFVVTSFVQNSEGTKVVLADEKNTVEIFFDGIPSMLRSATEGIRMRTWSEVQLKYNDKFIFENWFFFEIKRSKLIEWIIEESCNFYDGDKLNHFCIVTGEELIDIIASFEPVIKISKISNVLSFRK